MTASDLEAIALDRPDIGGGQVSEAARRWLAASATLDPRDGGAWSIRRRLTDRLLGCIMYFADPGGHDPEISYMVLPQWRRRGFGSEAVAMATAHLVGELGHEAVLAHVALDNVPSIALLRRLGFFRLPEQACDLRVGLDRRPAERWAWAAQPLRLLSQVSGKSGADGWTEPPAPTCEQAKADAAPVPGPG